jgi:hypothetical protein
MRPVGVTTRAALVVASLAAVHCTVPSVDFANKKCQSSSDCAAGESCSNLGACIPSDAGTGVDSTIRVSDSSTPPLGDATAPVSDACVFVPGEGNYPFCQYIPPVSQYGLCGIPALLFDVAKGKDPLGDPTGVNAIAYLQLGWSPTALHVSVHVQRHPVTPATGNSPVYEGDAVEVFASAPGRLTGPFGPRPYDEAIHVLVGAPPEAGIPKTEADNASPMEPLSLVEGAQYTSTLEDGGYVVDLDLSWDFIANNNDAGTAFLDASIGFDLAIDTLNADGGRFQSFLSYTPDGGSKAAQAGCLPEPVAPRCDDLLWNCTPRLVGF